MDTIFIKASKVGDDELKVDLVTLLILNVYKICGTENVQLRIVFEVNEQQFFKIALHDLIYEEVVTICEISAYCLWPVIVVGKSVVAGLCSVSRQIIKSCNNGNFIHLLGFREASLMGCSETSIWTKFCEVDMIESINDLIGDCGGVLNEIPVDLTKFEYHMEQPVRIHNVYAYARKKAKDKTIKSSVSIKDLNLAHLYAEGPFITLADVLLIPCIDVCLRTFNVTFFETNLPLTYAWYLHMQTQNLSIIQFELTTKPIYDFNQIEHINIKRQSLYTSDPNRYNPQSRMYTKQNNVENAINLISQIDCVNDIKPFGNEIDFDWGTIPLDANPEGGALPKKRANRKCEQLENLAKAVMKIAIKDAYKIVDFCSGSGHLGILLATLLPKSQIILVENKERSLLRAKERIITLNLTNVVILQCNLDYFCAKFDIGVSLHACGVATDLVMQNCVANRAHFVACPCCYGGIHDCPHIKYPRSEQFSALIDYKNYLNVAHAADQTHDKDNVKTKQGYLCMDLVDTDRKLYAEENGYDVLLGKLLPTTCTPKNNLIVGICK